MSSAGKQLAAYLEPLTQMQRVFVECKLKGMSDIASATAAGIANPAKNSSQFKKSAAVLEAIKRGFEISASEVMYNRKQAHDMYMDAHRNAATTTEQVMAINALVKLHGIAAPEQKVIEHKHAGRIEHAEVTELTEEQLLKLAKLPTAQLPAIIEGEYEEIPVGTDSKTAG